MSISTLPFPMAARTRDAESRRLMVVAFTHRFVDEGVPEYFALVVEEDGLVSLRPVNSIETDWKFEDGEWFDYSPPIRGEDTGDT